MKFTNASLVEQVLWDMRLADYSTRAENRAKLNRLANGHPPYSASEQEASQINTNVNWLEFPELMADARRPMHTAFLKPARFFKVTVDSGTEWKRPEWSSIITREVNKVMKRSKRYFEFLRGQIAQVVLHGIGIGNWPDKDVWCPTCIGIEDVMIPSNTLLSMDNLSYFGIFRQQTAMELWKRTHGHAVDPAWNMPVVDAAIAWANEQVRAELPYNDLFSPEKVEERMKSDGGFYGTDAVPTIDYWDFYFWSDEGKKSGWRRRMVLDTPATSEVGGMGQKAMPDKNKIGQPHGQWLYCPTDERVYADKLEQIVHFQFGDASAVAPFHYHTVRSLGWLLYSVCHLQNRLRCKVNDALFESLIQYFRASNPDDKDRVVAIDLHDRGIIPEGIDFVKPQDRWQVNQNLIQLGLTANQERMQKAASQYREGDQQSAASREKTATEIMAEVNSANAMVGAMLIQAYQYHEFQCQEIARRFCIKNSEDPEVREARNNILKRGVPEKIMDASMWNVEVERTLGSGNKTLEIAMADKLMAMYPHMDPASQRKVDHIYVLANSDNPDLATELFPLDEKQTSDGPHEADVALGSLMEGFQIRPKPGENNVEIIESWLLGMKQKLSLIQKKGMPTPEEIIGLSNIGQHIEQRIQRLAQDKMMAEKAKGYAKALAVIMGIVQKMVAAVQKQKQEQAKAGGNGGLDPKDAAKVQGMQLQAKTKAQLAAQSHAQKTQQRDQQFKLKMQQDAQKHRMEMGKKAVETKAEVAAKDLVTAADIRRGNLTTTEE